MKATAYEPELLYRDERFVRGGRMLVEPDGRIGNEADAEKVVRLVGKVLLPGFVNAHSHAFQRLIRGRAESRAVSGRDFWSWRNTMYQAAAALSPDDMFDVTRMCFLEMVKAGITTVGEFHYVHNRPDGTAYSDANTLARQVIRAAHSVGLRIVLLRSAYLRAGFELAPDAGQQRFYESADTYIENTAALLDEMAGASNVTVAVAPHSLRAVPLSDLHRIASWARERKLPIHMHVAEQTGENDACLREYGATPVQLLAREGLLGPDFVAVHAIHLDDREREQFAASGAIICSCPTTERNLGDGIVAADASLALGVRHAFGSDSQAQIAPLEDARELDYHLRLQQQQRAVLDQPSEDRPAIAPLLLRCATRTGAEALGTAAGNLRAGELADMVTFALNDLSIAGHHETSLLPALVFGAERSAVRDVMVAGRFILRDGHHPLEEEIVRRYRELSDRVWGPR